MKPSYDLQRQDKAADEKFAETIAKAKLLAPRPFRQQFVSDQIALYGGTPDDIPERIERDFTSALNDLITYHTPAGAEVFIRHAFNMLAGRPLNGTVER